MAYTEYSKGSECRKVLSLIFFLYKNKYNEPIDSLSGYGRITDYQLIYLQRDILYSLNLYRTEL